MQHHLQEACYLVRQDYSSYNRPVRSSYFAFSTGTITCPESTQNINNNVEFQSNFHIQLCNTLNEISISTFSFFAGLFRQPPPGYVPAALPGLGAPPGVIPARQAVPGMISPGMFLGQQGIPTSAAHLQVNIFFNTSITSTV